MNISQQVLDASALSKEEAEDLLGFLGEYIQSQLSERSEVTVSGVGTFTRVGDDVRFNPAKTLLTHVNYKYVGLPILDITGTVVSTEEPEAETEAISNEESYDDNFELSEAKPVEEVQVEETVDEPEGVEVVSDKKPSAESPKVVAAPSKKTVPKTPIAKTAPAGNQGLVVGIMLTLVVAVIIVFAMMNPETEEEPASQDSSALNEIILNKETVKEGNWGLNGSLDQSVKEFYTIVLFSLRNKENAYQMKANLENRGLRSFIQELEINGQQAYRVAVGQFPDTGMAQDSAGLLPDDLRSSYFLRKIQNN